MKISKAGVSTSVAIVGLIVSSNAFALPAISADAPMSSVKQCVAEIAVEANYSGAVRVRHEVSSKERRVSGHYILIDTTVFGDDGNQVIREYATVCGISDRSETRHFNIKEKSL